MKKCLPISLLVSLLCFGAAGCGGGKTSSPATSSSNPVSSSITEKVTVSSVAISYDGETDVLAGSTVKLSADVKLSDGSKGKVDWSTSDETIAKVTNGSVQFRNVLEDKEVTITATSKDDKSKSASITFTVKYSPINFANSRGNFDSSLFLEDGQVIVEKGDSALMFNEVYGTKWYVEAEITPSDDLGTPEDQYPKFGIMTGLSSEGVWNQEQKTLFYFVDAQNPAATNSWTAMGFVGQNDNYTDWNWGGVQGASVSGDNKFAKNETTKIGLMRDGIHYYLFAGRDNGYGVIKHIVNDHFAADEASYAWIGGWQTAYTVSGASYLIGDAIDGKYDAVTSITLSSYEQTLYVNDTYQLDYKLNTDMYNPAKLTFTSSNTDVATVSNTGLVTAGSTTGAAEITIAYEDVEATFNVEVTDDLFFKVDVDGQMNDLIWSETVKGNVYKHYSTNAAHETQIDLYASRNSKGIYFYADYSSKISGSLHINDEKTEDGISPDGWWQGDNMELRLYSPNGMLTNDKEIGSGNDNQYWISHFNGSAASNMSSHFVSAPVLNEETGRYEMSFEFFVSYAKANISKDTPVAFCMGANPDGSYWWNDAAWYTNFESCHKITANGIVRYLPEAECAEHNYAVEHTTPVTCKEDGLDTYTCKYCLHSYTQVVTATGEHNFAVEVSRTNATCHSEGSLTLQCAGCDTTKDEVLAIDPFAHDGENANDVWACCNKHGRNRWDNGGWGAVADWTYIAMGLTGDFEVTATIALETNGIVGNWWRGILPVVQDEIDPSVGEGSPWVTRFDWWGWCDEWQSPKLTQDWVHEGEKHKTGANRDMSWSDSEGNDVAGAEFETAMSKSTIEWKCTRVGTEVVNFFTIHSQNGNVYTFWSKATDISTEKALSLALASEFARYTVLSVEGLPE